MPVIYQGKCSECEAETPSTSEDYWAVFVDQLVSAYAHRTDPQLVVLSHPNEWKILEEIGYTPRAINWSGRLVRVKEVFCKSCGQPFEVRRLSAVSSVGCSGQLVELAGEIAIGIGVGVQVARAASGWIGILAGLATFSGLVFLIEYLVVRFIRWRYADRARRIDTPPQCPNCGSRKYASAGAIRDPIPCRACGERTVQFKVLGRS